jgi:hypothetical protein
MPCSGGLTLGRAACFLSARARRLGPCRAAHGARRAREVSMAAQRGAQVLAESGGGASCALRDGLAKPEPPRPGNKEVCHASCPS